MNWFNHLSGGRHPTNLRHQRSRNGRRRLFLEPLEHRHVLTACTVSIHLSDFAEHANVGGYTTFSGLEVDRNCESADHAITIFYSVGGTATPGVDHSLNSSGYWHIPDGSWVYDGIVYAVNDSEWEGQEEIVITVTEVISSNSNYSYTAAAGASFSAILHSDDAPPMTIAFNGPCSEGMLGLCSFTVTRSGPTDYSLSGDFLFTGSATSFMMEDSGSGVLTHIPNDFMIPPGSSSATITFVPYDDCIHYANGMSGTITVIDVWDDYTDYAEHSYPFTMLTIADNDAPPEIYILDRETSEPDSEPAILPFTLWLSCPSSETVTVEYSTVNGTAIAGQDFVQVTSGIVVFPPGEIWASAPVVLLPDDLNEEEEHFFVNLSNPSNASIADNLAIGNIDDDDDPPWIGIENVAVDESDGTATLTVTLSVPSGKAISVQFATEDGSARSQDTESNDYDYTSALGSLSFAEGETNKTITVSIRDDNRSETDEVFYVTLANVTNAIMGSSQGVVTITDNDPPILELDVDVDSDNNSLSRGPDGDENEDDIEDASALPGRYVRVNAVDADRDGIVD
jgi:hypothetical protein